MFRQGKSSTVKGTPGGRVGRAGQSGQGNSAAVAHRAFFLQSWHSSSSQSSSSHPGPLTPPPGCAPPPAGAQLVAGLEVQAGDQVLVKTRFSAFFDTNLDRILRWEC